MEYLVTMKTDTVEITYKNVSVKVHVLVTPEINDFMLSWHDLVNLKVLDMDFDSSNDNNINQMSNVDDEASVPNDNLEQIINDFSDVISDELPTKPIKDFEMKIHLDKNKPIPKSPYIAGRSSPVALEALAGSYVCLKGYGSNDPC